MKKWSSKIVIGLVFLFLYLPIIVLIVFSFNDTKLNILFETSKFPHLGNRGAD